MFSHSVTYFCIPAFLHFRLAPPTHPRAGVRALQARRSADACAFVGGYKAGDIAVRHGSGPMRDVAGTVDFGGPSRGEAGEAM